MATPTTGAASRDAAGEEFRRAAAGDGDAFAAFLVRHERRLLTIVRAIVRTPDVEDVFQEVCLRLVAKGHLYDPARPLKPWIDEVARNVARGWQRSRSATTPRADTELDAMAAPDPGHADPLLRDAVWQYVEARPAAERQVLGLVFGEGLTQRDAASRAGVPAGTVAGWLARAVSTLRARLGGGA